MSQQKLSSQISAWLKSGQTKNVGSMLDVFNEKSFAFLFLILMIFPAAPLPTGGLVHVFEVVVMLVALQLVIGRQDMWLPRRLQKVELSKTTRTKLLPFVVRRVEFFERFSKPRFAHAINQTWFRVQLGVFVILFTLGAFLAPPFTGLDTLPALGVVLISIGVILGDMLVIAMGYVVGFVGLAVAITLGIGIVTAIQTLF